MKRYLYWFAHGKPYGFYEIIVKRIIVSTFNYDNVYEVVNNNNKPYINTIIYVVKMNQSYVN